MDKLKKILEYKDLRNKILVAFFLLVVTRILAHIPLPNVNLELLRSFFAENQVFGFLNMFSGGTMSNFSIILMGVGPYITASIVFQLLAMIFPALEQMQKEGEAGRQKINQYTRLATIPLAAIQAYSMLLLLRNQGIIPAWTISELIFMLITVIAGTVLLMWIGEVISEKGIGNGISLIITIGILSSFPEQFRNTLLLVQSGDTSKIIGVIAFALIFLVVIASIIFIQEGQRNLPITYARKMRMGRSSGFTSHLPVRVNIAGVIPIIFAMSIMVIPGVIAQYLQTARSEWLANSAKWVSDLLQDKTAYGIIYFALVILFTFFYTSIVFKPSQVAENLQKQNGFIPGIRPGSETERYVGTVISRITLAGALFLGVIAVLPFIVEAATNITTLTLGGTGLLIVISVVIETMRQIDSQMVMHTYERY